MPKIEDMDIHQLIDTKNKVEGLIKMKQDGLKKPIYVISSEYSNSCFKDKEEALKNITKTFSFHHDNVESGYSESVRCHIRWMPESDYLKASDSWIEV